MFFLYSLLFSTAAALKTPSTFPAQYGDYTFTRLQKSRPAAVPETSELKITHHVVKLTRAETGTSVSSTFVRAMRQNVKSRVVGPQNGTTPLISVEGGSVFLANVLVGGQELSVVIDTGSSDPWLAITDFDCFNPIGGAPLPESSCEFGPLYNPAQSSTFEPIADQNFNISYADGEYLTGSLGYESFRMAGIDVPTQQFGVVDKAAWYGDEISSGLVGFAYRTLTSAYAGTNAAGDTKGRKIPYNPLFVNMYESQGVPPLFSLAMDRVQSNGGILALGGIPDVPHAPYWASTEIHPVAVNDTSGDFLYEFYTIDVVGFAVSSDNSTQFNPFDNDNPLKVPLISNSSLVIVDSGTTLIYAPDEVVTEVATAFNPPATWDAENRIYTVACNATPPVFGVGIDNKIFYVNPEDMIIPLPTRLCVMGVQPNNGGLNILGGVFMKNVLTVFDVGAEQLRFAARQYYPTTIY